MTTGTREQFLGVNNNPMSLIKRLKNNRLKARVTFPGLLLVFELGWDLSNMS